MRGTLAAIGDWSTDPFSDPASTPTNITSPPGWNASIDALMAANDGPAGIVPYKVDPAAAAHPANATAWQQFSAWANDHQTELLIGAAVIAALVILQSLNTHRQ